MRLLAFELSGNGNIYNKLSIGYSVLRKKVSKKISFAFFFLKQ